jgi:aspartyl-tRNA(Asn)/glutamyl-tRNA(Gln) amidotransferase subunit C
MSNPKITQDDVRHVAHLSRLKLSEGQVEHFTQQLEAILEYVGKLNELDIVGVEPMAHPLDQTDALRADESGGELSPEDALRNAPEQSPPYFKVPKVMGEGSGA